MAQASLVRICLPLTLALPIAAQFETSAVIQYTAERISLGFTPEAMNNRGWIVGGTAAGYPMRYRPGVGTEQMSESQGRLYDINDAGTAVGYLQLEGRQEAILRPAGSPWKRLGTLGGYSVARAINEAGQVVGESSERLGFTWLPFIYTEAEGMKMLFRSLDYAHSINEAGQIVGTRYDNYLWDPVLGRINIERQPGVDRGFRTCCIADNGVVAGLYNARQLATYSLTDGLRVVGEEILGGFDTYKANATNDRGWIVGHRRGKAFLYVYGQGIRDLDTLLVTSLPQPLTDAIDINDRDEILARTTDYFYILRRVRE